MQYDMLRRSVVTKHNRLFPVLNYFSWKDISKLLVEVLPRNVLYVREQRIKTIVLNVCSMATPSVSNGFIGQNCFRLESLRSAIAPHGSSTVLKTDFEVSYGTLLFSSSELFFHQTQLWARDCKYEPEWTLGRGTLS